MNKKITPLFFIILYILVYFTFVSYAMDVESSLEFQFKEDGRPMKGEKREHKKEPTSATKPKKKMRGQEAGSAESGLKPLECSLPHHGEINHLYGLKETDSACHMLSESRLCVHEDKVDVHIASEKDWHKGARGEVDHFTKAIRKELTSASQQYGPQSRSDQTNLLKFKIVFSSEDEDDETEKNKVEIDFETFFVSGWPAPHKKRIVKDKIRSKSVYFLSSLIEEFDERYKESSQRAGLAKEFRDIIIATAPDEGKHSFLKKERKGYEKTLKRVCRPDALAEDVQKLLLHTEQGLLFFLSQEENMTRIIEKLNELIASKGNQEIRMDFHICSHLSVCWLCGDRLFLEGEWGSLLLAQLTKRLTQQHKAPFNLKGHFWVSYNESRVDYNLPGGQSNVTSSTTSLPPEALLLKPYIHHIYVKS